MKLRSSAPLGLFAASLVLSCATAPSPPPPLVNEVLIFTKTAGFRHGSIPTGIACMEALAREAGLVPRASEDAGVFTDESLADVAVVVFLSTTGDILDPEQEAAFERYITRGGAFLGVHAATDTEYDWPFYTRLVGAQFDSHPKVQEARLRVVDSTSPATSFLPDPWVRTDEWYNFKALAPGLHVLLELDETSYEGGSNGAFHPDAWTHQLGSARAFYTAGGHTEASFAEPLFRQHLLGGLRWCARREAPADGTPESH